MKKIKITQVKSLIDRSFKQKRTMSALGIKRINQQVIKEATPQVVGMIDKIKHLVEIEEVK